MPRQYVFTIPVGPGNYARLRQTFESLAAQTVPLRIALCHAGAKDHVEHIIAPYRHLIAYERHAPDSGQSAAINEGWRALDGDVYGWLNADDMLAPGALAKVEALFDETPDASVACGQSLILNEQGVFTGLHPEVRRPDDDLFHSNTISQPSCFVKRDALVAAGYVRETLHYTMDWDLWVRLMENGARFAFTPDILSAVLWDENTKTGRFNLQRMKELRAVVARLRQPVTTAKTMIGFTINHVSEYTPAAPIAKVIRSILRSGRVQTLTYWGTPDDDGGTTLNLFHFADHDTSGLQLEFHRPATRSIACNVDSPVRSAETRVQFEASLRPGQRMLVKIGGEGFRPADIAFVSLEGFGSMTSQSVAGGTTA